MRILPAFPNLTSMIGAALVAPLCFSAAAAELTVEKLDQIPRADIILLGELHGTPAHHANQAKIVERIAPKALVFEMLSPAQAAAGQSVSRTDQKALDAALGWSDSAWPDFELYAPIFAAAPEAALFGAALPRDKVVAAIETGAAAQFHDAANFGLDQPLPAAQQAQREKDQGTAHCDALPEAMLPGMVEAQRLRDAAFAKTALDALDQTGGPVVVITGNGHARLDWGMPVYLRNAAPDVSVTAFGQLVDAADSPPFDAWIVTKPAADAGDPCDAFKSN